MEFRVKALDREQAVLAQYVDAIDETDRTRADGARGAKGDTYIGQRNLAGSAFSDDLCGDENSSNSIGPPVA